MIFYFNYYILHNTNQIIISKSFKMKAHKFLLLSFLFLCFSFMAVAQTKSEKFSVSGECGTCKKKIEKAAKAAGASYAMWDVDSKVLTVKYNSTSSNTAKIQQAVAKAGYDTPGFKATDEDYNNLDGCCQYERTAASASTSCCDDKKCEDAKCMKDGKCEKDMSCCKDSGCDTKACCKKS
jgi:periplasmic mercuric ion binding protein